MTTGYPARYEEMISQLDEVWIRAEAALAVLRDLDPLTVKDSMQIGKAMAAISISAEAAKAASSTLGRTSTTLWS